MLVARKPPVIFIAEDDAAVRELLETRLELAGYRTRWAANGGDTYDQCSRVKPDGLILDVNLPILDGFSILERWRQARVTPPATLMLTARHATSDVQRAIALGARDYLTKPFDDQNLLARVARLLRAPRPLGGAPHLV